MSWSQQWLAFSFETLINGALRLDPITRERLAELSGRVIALQPQGYDLVLYWHFSATGIRITTQAEHPPDLSIHADLNTLLQLLNGTEVSHSALGLHGDVQLARQLQGILAGLDLDWQEPVAKIFGDLAAQRLGAALRSGRDWGQYASDSLVTASREFLLYEQAFLPTRHQVEQFLDAVDRLRDDYERLEARVQRLQQRVPRNTNL